MRTLIGALAACSLAGCELPVEYTAAAQAAAQCLDWPREVTRRMRLDQTLLHTERLTFGKPAMVVVSPDGECDDGAIEGEEPLSVDLRPGSPFVRMAYEGEFYTLYLQAERHGTRVFIGSKTSSLEPIADGTIIITPDESDLRETGDAAPRLELPVPS